MQKVFFPHRKKLLFFFFFFSPPEVQPEVCRRLSAHLVIGMNIFYDLVFNGWIWLHTGWEHGARRPLSFLPVRHKEHLWPVGTAV